MNWKELAAGPPGTIPRALDEAADALATADEATLAAWCEAFPEEGLRHLFSARIAALELAEAVERFDDIDEFGDIPRAASYQRIVYAMIASRR